MNRRNFLGLLATPAIVKIGSLMPVQSLNWSKPELIHWEPLPPGIYTMTIEEALFYGDKLAISFGVPEHQLRGLKSTINLGA